MEPYREGKRKEMNNTLFTQLIKNQLKRCKEILLLKNEEYGSETDRLHNFNVGAAMTGKTPKEILGGFMLKHTISIYDMINSKEHFDIKQWNEKITDHINYLLLLKVIVYDETRKRLENESENS